MTNNAIKRACLGKARHASERAARLALRYTPNGVDLDLYRCRFCAHWHVGHRLENH